MRVFRDDLYTLLMKRQPNGGPLRRQARSMGYVVVCYPTVHAYLAQLVAVDAPTAWAVYEARAESRAGAILGGVRKAVQGAPRR